MRERATCLLETSRGGEKRWHKLVGPFGLVVAMSLQQSINTGVALCERDSPLERQPGQLLCNGSNLILRMDLHPTCRLGQVRERGDSRVVSEERP